MMKMNRIPIDPKKEQLEIDPSFKPIKVMKNKKKIALT